MMAPRARPSTPGNPQERAGGVRSAVAGAEPIERDARELLPAMLPETAHAVRQLLARILVDDFLQETIGDSALAVSPVHGPNRSKTKGSEEREPP